jgi:hypothetical protein
MNKFIKYSPIILSLLFLNACQTNSEKDKEENHDKKMVESISLKNDDSVKERSSSDDSIKLRIENKEISKNKVKKDERYIENLSLIDSIYIPDPLAKYKFSGDKFYALNRFKQTIVSLDENFNVVKELGGKGDAPELNKLIIDYFPLNDNSVLIIDPDKNDIKIQDFNNQLTVYRKFDFTIDKAAPINDKKIIIAHSKDESTDSRMNFSIWDIEKDSIFSLKNLSEYVNYPFSNLIADGQFIVDDSKRSILYFQYFHDHMLEINNDNQISKIDFIRQVKVPKGVDEGGWKFLDDSTPRQISAYLSNNIAFVISNIPEKQDRGKRVLDLYNIEKLRYLKSFILPKLNSTSPKDIVFHDNRYYLSYEDKIYILKEDKSTL